MFDSENTYCLIAQKVTCSILQSPVKTPMFHEIPNGPVEARLASQFHTLGALPSNGTSSAGQRCARWAIRSRDRTRAVEDAMGTAWGPRGTTEGTTGGNYGGGWFWGYTTRNDSFIMFR